MTGTEASPAGVWDAASDTWTDHRHAARWAWALRHLPDPVHIYRVEFFEGPAAIVYRFALSDQGSRYLDETGEPAVLPPARLLLAELPAADLLGQP